MKIEYYPETDSLYIDLLSRPSVDSRVVSEGAVLDYDEEENLVGIDIDKFSLSLLSPYNFCRAAGGRWQTRDEVPFLLVRWYSNSLSFT